jgi:hypothetical protein
MKTKPHKEMPLFNINTNKINVKSTTEHILHEVLLSTFCTILHTKCGKGNPF